MSVQVGGYCYATNADAAPAACAAFVPLSQLQPDGQTVKTVACTGVNAQTGALQITVTTLPPAGAQSAVVMEQTQTFPPCVEQDKVEASLAVFGALLALVGVAAPGWLLIRWLNRNERNEAT